MLSLSLLRLPRRFHCQKRTETLQGLGTNTRHTGQRFQARKRPVDTAIFNNSGGPDGPDSREGLQRLLVHSVEWKGQSKNQEVSIGQKTDLTGSAYLQCPA